MLAVHASTVATILCDWIREREKYEREQLGYTRDSCLLATGRDMFEAVKNGEIIEIRGAAND
jgi:hypothetical protein